MRRKSVDRALTVAVVRSVLADAIADPAVHPDHDRLHGLLDRQPGDAAHLGAIRRQHRRRDAPAVSLRRRLRRRPSHPCAGTGILVDVALTLQLSEIPCTSCRCRRRSRRQSSAGRRSTSSRCSSLSRSRSRPPSPRTLCVRNIVASLTLPGRSARSEVLQRLFRFSGSCDRRRDAPGHLQPGEEQQRYRFAVFARLAR